MEDVRDAPVLRGEAKRRLAVVGRDLVADGVVHLRLAAQDGGALPRWEPGAHVAICVGPGLVKHYSLCGDPDERDRYEIAVLREPEGQGGSIYLHDQVTVGNVLEVSDPRNHFAMVNSPNYLFIAGGIGVTPLLPMVQAAEALGADWRLVYGGRTRSSMAFLDRLERYSSRVTVWPADEEGLIDLAAVLGDITAPTYVYCCGPLPLLRAVEKACGNRNDLKMHFELFTPPDAANGGGDTAFEVELVQSGLTVPVAKGGTILEAVEAAGVDILSSCRNGMCGTCETAIIEGVPDHRDCFLSEDERAAGATMMICVSRALSSRLILDL